MKVNKVEDFFNRNCDAYSGLFSERKAGKNYQFGKRLAIAKSLSEGRTGALLDCAVGSGEIMGEVLRAGRFDSAHAVDISGSMLARARSTIDRTTPSVGCSYFRSDVFEYLSSAYSKGRRYDFILCLGLIAHTGRLDELLRLIRSVMNDAGGMVLLQSTLLDSPGTRMERFVSSGRYKRREGYNIAYYQLDDLRRAAELNGLKVMREERFGLSIPFGDKIWAFGNYYAEKLAAPVTQKHGAEVILQMEACN